jgi:hypothetical protein
MRGRKRDVSPVSSPAMAAVVAEEAKAGSFGGGVEQGKSLLGVHP